jgi:hypothetical protein
VTATEEAKTASIVKPTIMVCLAISDGVESQEEKAIEVEDYMK